MMGRHCRRKQGGGGAGHKGDVVNVVKLSQRWKLLLTLVKVMD